MTIQDLPGRTVGKGMPCSGPMDDLAFSVGNILVGNENKGTEGLEIIVVPGVACSFEFFAPAIVAVTGKPVIVKVNGFEHPMWSRICLASNSKVEIVAATSTDGRNGFRTYFSILGGFPDIPHYLGSKSTSMGFGGYQVLTHTRKPRMISEIKYIDAF
jgi:urea carboxylase